MVSDVEKGLCAGDPESRADVSLPDVEEPHAVPIPLRGTDSCKRERGERSDTEYKPERLLVSVRKKCKNATLLVERRAPRGARYKPKISNAERLWVIKQKRRTKFADWLPTTARIQPIQTVASRERPLTGPGGLHRPASVTAVTLRSDRLVPPEAAGKEARIK